MTNFKIGNIVLGDFPYTDSEASKKRLFVIIAIPRPYLWALMITSQFSHDDGCKYVLSDKDIDFKLNKDSIICFNVIQTINPKVCERVLGNLLPECLDRIKEYVSDILNQS